MAVFVVNNLKKYLVRVLTAGYYPVYHSWFKNGIKLGAVYEKLYALESN